MKKLLFLLAAVGMIFTACETGGVDEGGNGDLPSNKIATIEEQGANITATIATLQTTKSAVEATIASLKASEEPATRGNDNGNNGVKTMIAALEERVEALEQMISNLTGYTQGDLTEMQDWATATFATMEQYNALAAELATLKALLEGFEGVSTAELSEALAASEESMKQWVNEQLAGYATIADVEAQIAVLTASLTEKLKAEVEKVVATLTALMNDTKQEYEKAIAEAIQNQGIINEQIAKDIADINKRIDKELATINKRLDDIEKRLDEIEETVKDLVNRIQSISYLKKHGALPTPVEITAEKASINLDFKLSPKSVVASLADNWSECLTIKAYYREVNTKISLPIETLSADEEDGTISLTASAEGFSDEFFSKIHNAYLYLNISDGNNDRDSEVISICPQVWFRDDVVDLVPNNNEIYYTTAWDTYEDYVEYSISTEPLTTMPSANSVDATAVSCLYDWRRGVFVITFDKEVTELRSALLGWFNDMGELVGSHESICALALPESLTKIGNDAFYECFMASLRIPKNVTSIGDNAFYWATDIGGNGLLRSVYFDSPMPPLFNLNFGGATPNIYVNIESVDIYKAAWPQCADRIFSNGKHGEEPSTETNTITYTTTDGNIIDTYSSTLNHTYKDGVGKFVIYDSDNSDMSIYFAGSKNLASVTIGNGITKIGDYAFRGCTSLTSVTIGNGVTSIERSAFSHCTSLTSVRIPNGVTSIGRHAFAYCTSLTSVTIPDSVTLIGEGAFGECASLTSVTIPDSVTSIGNSAFYNCTSLTSVTIPDSVTSIGKAFYNCKSLKEVYCKPTIPPTGGSDMFSYYDSGYKPIGCKIYVPTASVDAYKSAEYWKDYADYIEGHDF